MKIIVPCCGRSSRYPNQPPKWILPAPDGRPMISLAVSRIAHSPSDLVVTILREHEERYSVTKGLEQAFRYPVRVVVLEEPTRNQAETVARTLDVAQLDEPFLIKDSDNMFVLENPAESHNYVCVDSLNAHDSINPRNKSYLQTDHADVVTNIREKEVISDLFCVGGYYFTSPRQFQEYFRRLTKNSGSWQRELYVSDVIGAMILDGIPFKACRISGYQDWGTVHEWKRALLARKTFFVLLDGFLFERGSQYFSPRFEDVAANAPAVDAVRELAARGHKIVYLSIRPASLGEATQRRLRELGLPGEGVVYECPISHWSLVTAAHPTLPFRTSEAFELAPDDENVLEKLLQDG
jgi:dTDP-glucose pyrophosphorylase